MTGWQIILSLFLLLTFAYSLPQSRQKRQDLRETGKWKPDGSNDECGKRLSISNIVGKATLVLKFLNWQQFFYSKIKIITEIFENS